MSIDSALFTWLEGEVSGIVRESDALRGDLEPPLVSYLPTDFSDVVYGDATAIRTTVTIRVRVNEGEAYDNSGTGDLDTLVDGVRAALEGETPTISGWTANPLTNVREGPARDGGRYTFRDISFELSLHEGFAVAPMYGGDGSVEITGVSGEYRGYSFESNIVVDREHTDDEQAVEEVNTGFPRGQGRIVLAGADNATPIPAVGSRPSTTFGIGSSLSWSEEIIVTSVGFRFDETDPSRVTDVLVGFTVDSATSPFFTGVAP